MTAYDMSRFDRLIYSEGRANGYWWVGGGTNAGAGRIWITPVDVTIYDEDLRAGRVFNSADFKVVILNDDFLLTGWRNPDKLPDLEDAWDIVTATLREVAQVWRDKQEPPQPKAAALAESDPS